MEAKNSLEKWQINANTIKIFGLGYAPDSIDALTKYLLQEGYTKESLVKSGIAILTENGDVVDRFQNRIMIPIIDVNENVIGFSGRIIETERKGNPTYINNSGCVFKGSEGSL